jgi:hypothetical protein
VSFIGPPAQPIDEDINQAQHIGLATRPVVGAIKAAVLISKIGRPLMPDTVEKGSF